MSEDESHSIGASVDGRKDAVGLPWRPVPGILSAILPWPMSPPPITDRELCASHQLLSELAGACSNAVIFARSGCPLDKFVRSVAQVQASFSENLRLFVYSAWAAHLAKNTTDPARCGDVTMESMHAAVIQMACNIAESQGTAEECRRYFARDSLSLPASEIWGAPGLVNLPEVSIRLRGEFTLARKYLLAATTGDALITGNLATPADGAEAAENTKATPKHPAIIKMQERDAWCFDRWQDGETLDGIVAHLAREAPSRKWRKLTRSGVRTSIKRHARNNDLPLPKGKGGRPRKSTDQP